MAARALVLCLCWLLCLAQPAGATPAGDRAAFLAQADAEQPRPHPEPGYRFWAEQQGQLAERVREMPGRVQPMDLGTTVDGAHIWGFLVADPARPIHTRVLVFAGLHAMEWVGSEVAVDLVDLLAADPPTGVAVVVVPVVNIDKRLMVEADLRAGTDRFLRSNRNQVDLNRDWAHNRTAPALHRWLLPRMHQMPPGDGLTQPETQALDRLAQDWSPHVSVSLHSYGGFVYVPWAGRFGRLPPADLRAHLAWGRVMAAGQGAHAYRVRQLSRWGFFARITGTELDHMFAQHGSLSFLIELTRTGLSPWRPKDWSNAFRMYNPAEPRRSIDHGLHALRALVWTLSQQQGTQAPDHL